MTIAPSMGHEFWLCTFSNDPFPGYHRKKRSTNAEAVTITFADVAGVDSAKLELAEVVSVMKVRCLSRVH